MNDNEGKQEIEKRFKKMQDIGERKKEREREEPCKYIDYF